MVPGILILVLLVLGLLALGPTPPVSTRTEEPELPEDIAELDDWLRRREAKVPALREELAWRIAWASGARRRSRKVLIYFHGFTASHRETAPLCDELAAKLGANLVLTRLRGHGRDADALRDVTVRDWLQDARDALAIARRIGEEVVVIGKSTGAGLVLWASEREWFGEVHALMLMSPNFEPWHPMARALTLPWGHILVRILVGRYRHVPAYDELHERYWTRHYHTNCLLTMMALVERANLVNLEAIRTPVWFAWSPQDRTVRADRIAAAYARLRAPIREKLVLDRSHAATAHVLAGDALAPDNTALMVREMAAFLARVDAAHEASPGVVAAVGDPHAARP